MKKIAIVGYGFSNIHTSGTDSVVEIKSFDLVVTEPMRIQNQVRINKPKAGTLPKTGGKKQKNRYNNK